MKKYVLSVDPALRNYGWSVWNISNDDLIDFGLIETKRGSKGKDYVMLNNDADLRFIVSKLCEIIDKYPIKLIFSELVGGSQNSKAATSLALGHSAISLTAYFKNIPIDYITERHVKRFLFARDKVSKKEMMQKIRSMYPDKNFVKTNKFEHTADSIGVYLTLKETSEYYKLIKGGN